jgi:hypothetical protein
VRLKPSDALYWKEVGRQTIEVQFDALLFLRFDRTRLLPEHELERIILQQECRFSIHMRKR